MADELRCSRRTFLGGAAALTLPYFVPASALGAEDRAPANDRIQLGAIGIGARGTHDLRAMMQRPDTQVLAVCDVRGERRKAAKTAVDRNNGNSDCATYRDLRELLARDDIDAVLIATSDRWHTMASVLAMKAGKDVYCEKPCAVTVEQSRVLAETARRYGRVFQAGTQRRSETLFVFVMELARLGMLGELHTLTAHIRPGFAPHVWFPPEPEPAPDVLDWDMYQGPIPWRPYNHRYLRRTSHPDLWAGGLHEWGAHTFDLCQWANDSVDTTPVEYEFPNNDTSEGLTAHYANGVRLLMTAHGFPGSCGARFEGSEGWAECSDGRHMKVHPESLLGEQDRIIRAYQARTGRPLNHVADFLDCVRTRRQPTANADVARHAHTICHVGAICMALRRNVKWDPDREEFIGDEEANRMRSRAMRAPWSI